MGTTNYGTQTTTFKYKQAALSSTFNALNDSLIPTGIYSGGLLSRVSDGSIQVAPLTCYIKDTTPNSNISRRVQTTSAVSIVGFTSTDCYCVLRYSWVASETDYMDILAVDYNTLFATETTLNQGYLLLGKAIYEGATMLSYFDYTFRSDASLQEIEDEKNSFYVKPYNDPTIRRIYVYPGKAVVNGKYIDFSGDTYPSAPSTFDNTTLGRIDVIYVDATGTIKKVSSTDQTLTITYPLNFNTFESENPGAIPDFPTDGMVVAIIIRGLTRNTIEGRDIIQIEYERNSFTGAENDITFKGCAIFEQNVQVAGNLHVQGNMIIDEGTITEYEDNIITLNKPPTGCASLYSTSGIDFYQGGPACCTTGFGPNDAQFLYDCTVGYFKAGVMDCFTPHLQRVVTQQLIPQVYGVPFWSGTKVPNSDSILEYDQFFTFNNACSANKILNIGNVTCSAPADVRISGGMTIGQCAPGDFDVNINQFIVNETSVFNNNVTIKCGCSILYREHGVPEESLDTRYLRASASTYNVVTLNDFYIGNGSTSQKRLFVYLNDGSGCVNATPLALEDAFLFKKCWGSALPGYIQQSIETSLIICCGKTLTYMGDELDQRHVRTNYTAIEGNTPALAVTMWGDYTIKQAGSNNACLNIQGTLRSGLYNTSCYHLLATEGGTFTWNGCNIIYENGCSGACWNAFVSHAQYALQTCGNSTTASNFNTNRCAQINGVGGSCAYSICATGDYVWDISAVKINLATCSQYLYSCTTLIPHAKIVTTDGTGGTTNLATTPVGNADMVDGYHASSSATGNTVAVRDGGGILHAYGFNVVSKRALKENIKVFNKSALGLVKTVEVVEYNYILDPEKSSKIGFIADDTREEFSTSCHNTMDVTSSIGILLKAVQELDKKISCLENK